MISAPFLCHPPGKAVHSHSFLRHSSQFNSTVCWFGSLSSIFVLKWQHKSKVLAISNLDSWWRTATILRIPSLSIRTHRHDTINRFFDSWWRTATILRIPSLSIRTHWLDTYYRLFTVIRGLNDWYCHCHLFWCLYDWCSHIHRLLSLILSGASKTNVFGQNTKSFVLIANAFRVAIQFYFG